MPAPARSVPPGCVAAPSARPSGRRPWRCRNSRASPSAGRRACAGARGRPDRRTARASRRARPARSSTVSNSGATSSGTRLRRVVVLDATGDARQRQHRQRVGGAAAHADDVQADGVFAMRAPDFAHCAEHFQRRRRDIRSSVFARRVAGAAADAINACRRSTCASAGSATPSPHRQRALANASSCTAESWRRSSAARWKPKVRARHSTRCRAKRPACSPRWCSRLASINSQVGDEVVGAFVAVRLLARRSPPASRPSGRAGAGMACRPGAA